MFGTFETKTILAKDKYLSLDTWKTQLNNNVMLVGASGRGKTRYFIKPNIMQMNCNYVISDPKGVLIGELGDMLQKNGYKIKLLNLVDMKHSNTYNPFAYIKSETDVYKLIDYLMSNMRQGRPGHTDPFWDNAEKALLSAICFYLYYECNMEDRTLANAIKLLRCLEIKEGFEDYESTLDIMFRQLKERNPEHIAVKQYQVFKSGAGKTVQSIQISAEVDLQYFNVDDYIYIENVKTLVEQGAKEFPAKVIGKSTKNITLKMDALTDAEKQIILKGCLINYYKG